jgi:hypothetical protein
MFASTALPAIALPDTQPARSAWLPVRPRAGLLGSIAFELAGRGERPRPLTSHQEWMHSDAVTHPEAIEQLRRVFIGQLGPSWKSFSEASPVTRLIMLRLAATFLDPSVVKDIDASLEVITSRPVSMTLDLADIESVLRRYEADPKFGDWADHMARRNAFERTVVLAAVEHALRYKGSAAVRIEDLPWLPFVDRTLWAAIHFKICHLVSEECAGIFSHLNAEKREHAAIAEPQVDHALDCARKSWRERLVFDVRRRSWVFLSSV